MNLIEDRIRAAALRGRRNGGAGQRPAAGTARGTDRGASAACAGAPARRTRRSTLDAPGWRPLAAALAVIAIVITVVTVSHFRTEGGPDSSPDSAAVPDVPLGPPVSYVRQVRAECPRISSRSPRPVPRCT